MKTLLALVFALLFALPSPTAEPYIYVSQHWVDNNSNFHVVVSWGSYTDLDAIAGTDLETEWQQVNPVNPLYMAYTSFVIPQGSWHVGDEFALVGWKDGVVECQYTYYLVP